MKRYRKGFFFLWRLIPLFIPPFFLGVFSGTPSQYSLTPLPYPPSDRTVIRILSSGSSTSTGFRGSWESLLEPFFPFPSAPGSRLAPEEGREIAFPWYFCFFFFFLTFALSRDICWLGCFGHCCPVLMLFNHPPPRNRLFSVQWGFILTGEAPNYIVLINRFLFFRKIPIL